MIDRAPFGSTGHASSRVIFGAAALGAMKQDRADQTLALITSRGINHIDTAASYGESEVRLKDFLSDHRSDVFLATKTGDRDGDGARASLERSLERMGVDSVDMIQLHNLVAESDWERAMAPGGAADAMFAARDEGLVKHVGVTGHGFFVADMHMRSLEKHDFASVLVPCSHSMLAQPEYHASFTRLVDMCAERGVAVQTIKAIAKGRWPADFEGRKFSWYEPVRDEDAIRRAVHFVLSRPGMFLNTTSDATLLPFILDAAEDPEPPALEAMTLDAERFDIEPLFTADGPQGVG